MRIERIRRPLALVLCLVMLLGLMPTVHAEETEPVNVVYNSLQNGDFEAAITDLWFTMNSTAEDKFGRETVNIKDGTGALRLTDGKTESNTVNTIRSHLFKVEAGESYTISYDVKSTHETPTGAYSYVYIYYFNEQSAVVGTKGNKVFDSKSWSSQSFESEAPEGAVTARIVVNGSGHNGPTNYFDNLSVESSVNKIYDSLQNPSFELTNTSGKLTHWYAFDVESHSQSTEHVTDGTYSMKIDDAGLYVGGAESNRVRVTPGERYRATIDCYAATESTQAQLYLRFYNAEGTATSTIGYGTGDGIDDTIVVEAIAPDDAVYATIMPLSHSRQEGVFYFDNASFGLVPPPTFSDTLENPSLEIPDPSNPMKAEGYTFFGSTTYKTATRTNEKASDGEWSVKMTDASDNANTGYQTPAFKVEPGVTYRATADFYLEGGYIQFYIRFFDKDGNHVGSAGVDVGGKDSWKKGVVDGDAPANAVFAELRITQSVDNVGVAYADNFTVEPYEASSEWTILETEHPRLYFTADEVGDIKTRANDAVVNAFGYSNKETFNAILAKADLYLTETEFSISYYNGYVVTYPSPVVTQPDNPNSPPGYTDAGYPYWTMLSYEIEDRLSYLSLAFTVTGEAKYLNKALEHIQAMIGWNVWHDPYTVAVDGATAGLDTSHITMGMSLAYDLLYNEMDESLRTQVRDAILTKGLAPLYTEAANKGDHNIALIRAAALGIGACAIADPTDAELSADVNAYLSRANDFYKWYLDARMTTGVQEGYQYTSYALENLIAAMDIIGRVTGETGLLDNDYFNEVFVDWVVHFMAPGSGTLPGISDCNSAAYFFNTMNILNKSKLDGNAGYYLSIARPNAESLLQKFLYTSTDPVINDPYETLELIYTTDYLGFAALRTGWEEDDMLLTLLANDSDITHNHYDQNSFMLATRGTWIATDAGYGNFVKGTPANEWTIRYGHSTLLVDDQTQSIKGGGSIEEILGNTLYGHVVGSAAEAYGEGVLDKFDRHAILINHEDGAYYVLLDDIAASGSHTYGWNLNTEGWSSLLVDGEEVTLGSTVTGSSLTIEKTAASMFVDFIGNDPLSISARMYRDSEGPYITAYSPAASNYQYMAVISAAAGNNGIPAVSLMNTVQTNNNQETKTVAVDGVDCVFFRAAEVGDWFSVDFEVESDGVYNMSLELPKSSAYGNYQMYIDDVACGDVYVGYGETVLHDHSLGEVSLTAGKHTLKLELVGKEEASGNYLISLGTIKFGGENAAPTSAISILNTYDTADYLGAEIGHTAGKKDLVLFRRTSNPKSVTIGDLSTDASQVSLLSIKDDGIAEGLAAVGVTSLTYNGTNWISCSSPINVILDLRDGNARYTIESEVAQSVTLNVGVNGKQKTVELSAGTNEIDGGSFFETSVSGVSLNKSEVALEVGATETLTATVSPEDATTKTVSWKSSDEDVATVDNNGKVTAISKGEATITVTTTDGSKSAECVVTVTLNTSAIDTAITAATTAKSGIETIDGKDEDEVAKDTKFVTTAEMKALTDAIAAAEAAKDSAKTPAEVTAAANALNEAVETFEDAVKTGTYVAVSGVALNKEELTLEVGATETLTATVTPEDATTKTVSWKSSNEDVATVDQTGKVTAISKGEATITVTTTDGSKSAECVVTVTLNTSAIDTAIAAANTAKSDVETIDDKDADEVAKGTKFVTTAEMKALTDAIAAAEEAKESAKTPAEVTAAVNALNEAVETFNEAVKTGTYVAVSGVSLNKSEVTLEAGATETLTATVAPEDATTKTVSWKSSNEDVATVDQNGKVTAVAKGEATITVTTTDGSKTATCDVTVTLDASAVDTAIDAANTAKSGVETVDDKDADEVAKGTKFVTTAEMKALTDAIAAAEEAKDSAKTPAEVTAAVNALNEAVETFEDAVKTGTYVATTEPLDTSAIDAAIAGANSAKASVETIDDKDADKVAKGTKFVTTAEMKALTDAIAAAESAKASAKTPAEVTAAVNALNTAVETFEDAVKTGTYVAVSGVALNKSEVTLEVGATETLTATVSPEDATTKTVSWKSSNEDVATVDQNGKITAISKGEVTITVTTNDGNKTATCKVTVTVDPSDSTEPESPTDPTEDETNPTEPETPTDGKPESSTPGTGDNFPLVLITLTLLLSLVGMIVLLWSKRSMNGKHVK